MVWWVVSSTFMSSCTSEPARRNTCHGGGGGSMNQSYPQRGEHELATWMPVQATSWYQAEPLPTWSEATPISLRPLPPVRGPAHLAEAHPVAAPVHALAGQDLLHGLLGVGRGVGRVPSQHGNVAPPELWVRHVLWETWTRGREEGGREDRERGREGREEGGREGGEGGERGRKGGGGGERRGRVRE